MKVTIAGLKVDAFSKQDLLDEISARLKNNQKTWITTLYSEFLYAAMQDTKILEMLNKADIAVADGIGIFWANKYLSIPLTAKSYSGKILQAFWQAKYSLAAILFNPGWIKPKNADKIPGSDLIWDLTKLAAKNNFSIYLLGGFGDTPEMVKKVLISKYPNILISTSNKHPTDPTIVDDIKKISPNILFVAFGPIKQEQWIAQNLPNLPVKLAIGLGGTFDYIAGKRLAPPLFLRKIGLEWLWRLVTQPHRIKRIWNATFGLINQIILYKIFVNMPFRPNALGIIIKNKNQILICQRNPNPPLPYKIGEKNLDKFKNYWQFPQGGLNPKEDVVAGAMREIKEETGIENLEFLKTSASINTYFFRFCWERIFHKKYRWQGQNQSIVYFKFFGNDSDIKVDKLEFEDFKWVPISDLDKEIHPERLTVAKIVQEDLKDLA